MTTVAEIGNIANDNSKFTQDFEEYRRACREKYQQQKPQTVVEEEEADCSSEAEETPENCEEGSNEIQTSTEFPGLKDARFTISPAETSNTCNDTLSPLSPPTNRGTLNSSVDNLKRSTGGERRNSFSKVMSSFTNIFKKSGGDSPKLSPKPSPKLSAEAKAKEKERIKAEKDKAEQDWRMARFIAELEFEGRTDQEIQTHLFHIRDQAQFARPRSNSVGEWFRGMHQAFKDEFSARKCVTVHVSTVNPFSAAPPANYVHDGVGYTYEELVALENVPRGLKSLDHLPTLVFEGQELPSNQTTCAVCMAEFEVTEGLRSLHCTHHFHQECIDKWLGVATTCPVCKTDVCSE